MPARQQPADHVVRLVAADFAPCAGLIRPGKRHGIQLQFEPFLFGKRFQDLDRFLAKGIIQIDEPDLRLAQVTAHLTLDEGNVICRLLPVRRTDRENPFEHFAVHRVTAANKGLHQHVAVLHRTRQNRVRDRRGQKIEKENAFALELLVAFHTALRFVAVIANDDFNRMPFDTAIFVGVHRQVLRGLGHLRRNERVGFTEVEAESEADRLLVLR